MTDCCPGFGSAAKYIAVSTREAALDVLSMARTSTKVFVLEVMGRHAGWIAAAGGLAGEKSGDAPHIILFPEITFDRAQFLEQGEDLASRNTATASIVVSEGVRNADGKFLAEAGTKDAFGHAQLGGVGPVVAQMTQEAFGYKFHWAVADYLQRSARHIASKVDVEQAYAVGKAAVQFALCKARTRSCRSSCASPPTPYRWSIGEAPLREHRQPGKEGSAQFHHRRRIRHHRRLPPLPAAADRRRGLPAIPRRPAGLRRRSRAAASRSACANPLWYSLAAASIIDSNNVIIFQ